MFTGIIECIGLIESVKHSENGNCDLEVRAPFTNELIPGQSVSHNGVCLTVTDIYPETYMVTAIGETLLKSNLGKLERGSQVNLERCMKADGRFDGHIVQGHVDTKAICERIVKEEGQTAYFFRHFEAPNFITVEKGSVTVNGISLTVVESGKNYFSVSIIPYTLKNTNLNMIQIGAEVNIEFDVIGKYLFKMHQNLT